MKTTQLWGSLKSQTFVLQNASLKDKPQKGRKYLHIIYLIKIKDLDPEHTGKAVTNF